MKRALALWRLWLEQSGESDMIPVFEGQVKERSLTQHSRRVYGTLESLSWSHDHGRTRNVSLVSPRYSRDMENYHMF